MSLFFNKPIIVSGGFYLSDSVKEMDCGCTIDASSKESISRFVESLNAEAVKKLSERLCRNDTACK